MVVELKEHIVKLPKYKKETEKDDKTVKYCTCYTKTKTVIKLIFFLSVVDKPHKKKKERIL